VRPDEGKIDTPGLERTAVADLGAGSGGARSSTIRRTMSAKGSLGMATSASASVRRSDRGCNGSPPQDIKFAERAATLDRWQQVGDVASWAYIAAVRGSSASRALRHWGCRAWLVGTADLTTEESGAFWNLCCY
jgi:hypothetical protein